MKKLYQYLPPAEHRFYSLNFLLAENAAGGPRNTLVDLSKKADSAHYGSRDFQTFLFNKHISRVLASPEALSTTDLLSEEL
ncbi:hypothetical protein D3Y59_12030 [Hymenobacter oligotrophus]|uniref:Uncharacterized protein n=1 Tax=Hymenobacter oligotrophus TaxID=2319843 RepID=A0A3B7R308_9BACT|nr:hypothetical protein [Hymenobacter oligotrophus]AYA37710.1 hypothetical protein D3Y59_12030 [Hymenobacter oligotrophus]